MSGDDISRRSRANSWHPTDPREMKQFLGLLFLTGIIRKPAINLYWSTDPLYSTPLFGAIMSRNRFQLLLKFLHFNDNAEMPGADDPSPDKLFKVRPLVDHLCEKFGEVYTPSSNISIDESLLLWKGRLGFKQYIPLKRARFARTLGTPSSSKFTREERMSPHLQVHFQSQRELWLTSLNLCLTTGTPAYHC